MPPRFLAIMLWLAAAASADPEPAPAPDREAIVEHLLSERESPEKLAAAIAAAVKAGVGEQGILEARFLYHVDRREDAKLAALAPQFLARRDTFKVEDSEIFATREDWLAVTEYVQALAALEREDVDGFKKHITEAFWLSPRQGAAFAPHIDRLRLDEAMKNTRVDPATRLATLDGSEAVALSRIDRDATAYLLHFWSPWSRECEATMPDFIATATELRKHKVAIASILPEQSDEVRAEARELLEPFGANPPGAWLVDRPKDPLSRILRIQSLPAMVLLDAGGRVLFNGHPADDGFWIAIGKIAPDAARPPSPDAP